MCKHLEIFAMSWLTWFVCLPRIYLLRISCMHTGIYTQFITEHSFTHSLSLSTHIHTHTLIKWYYQYIYRKDLHDVKLSDDKVLKIWQWTVQWWIASKINCLMRNETWLRMITDNKIFGDDLSQAQVRHPSHFPPPLLPPENAAET